MAPGSTVITTAREYEVTEAHIRTARHAYYGNISLVDDLIGSVLDTLRNIRELDDTAIVFCADHGDMLGERGLWYKMAPYERSTRIPLIVSTPDAKGGRRVSANVSLIDLLPTVLDLAGEGGSLDPIEPLDGRSLVPFLTGGGEGWGDVAVSELFFEGLAEPALMLRKGRYKYIHCNRETAVCSSISRAIPMSSTIWPATRRMGQAGGAQRAGGAPLGFRPVDRVRSCSASAVAI